MTVDEQNIIWLDTFEFLSYQKKVKILSLFDVEENIREMFSSKKFQMSTFLSLDEYEKISNETDEYKFLTTLSSYEKQNIQLITLYSNLYPKLLKEIETPPLCLYCKGNLQMLNSVCCGVVGTRRPTDYGKIVTKQFVKELSNCGVTVVSGLASGIDTFAHQTAIENNGATIAVIAGGFNHIYPSSNYSLYLELIKNNLVISESKPDTHPSTYLFPIRNRIIAGLSKAVLITEASEKSGSLHTKNYAVEFGREVFAIPGKINSPESEGTNNIIKQCQSCLCTDPKQIIDYLGVEKKEINKKPAFQLDINEQTILNYILVDKKTYQEIADFTKLAPKELNTILLNMQMKGMVERLMGNSFIALIKN